ncbi:hypothetical protein RRG08_065852 [Elysia crispata]|uniref:Uncharacterized protein n=1 Tax=Elysia crispata TaxID=231223 RepID=A0AAE0ZB51_9GAST|nr:hypothetical protein RRG08_065852 [Elysia crispata]
MSNGAAESEGRKRRWYKVNLPTLPPLSPLPFLLDHETPLKRIITFLENVLFCHEALFTVEPCEQFDAGLKLIHRQMRLEPYLINLTLPNGGNNST